MPVRNLGQLPRNARPVLQHGSYLFVPLPAWPDSLSATEVLMSRRERDGLTFVIPQRVADEHDLTYKFIPSRITMPSHSALEAAGFTAAFASVPGRPNISCNVVLAFHHDRLFVAQRDGKRAIEVLRGL